MVTSVIIVTAVIVVAVAMSTTIMMIVPVTRYSIRCTVVAVTANMLVLVLVLMTVLVSISLFVRRIILIHVSTYNLILIRVIGVVAVLLIMPTVATIIIKIVVLGLMAMISISIIMSAVTRVHVLVGGSNPMAGRTRTMPPSLTLTLSRPHTHVYCSSEAHACFNHIWRHMTGIPRKETKRKNSIRYRRSKNKPIIRTILIISQRSAG